MNVAEQTIFDGVRARSRATLRFLLMAAALGLTVSVESVYAATYYVAPGGNDGNPGTQSQPWRTIGKANSTLQAGDKVLIKAGNYSNQIRPSANGTSNNNRIIYQAFGDGDVRITDFNPTDTINEGAIGLGGKKYVSVIGRADSDPVNVQRIKAIPSSFTNAYANLCGAEGSIIENVYMGGTATNNCGNVGLHMCKGWWGGTTESKLNIVRNNHVIGCAISGTQYTEDLIRIDKNSHHNLFENNTFENARHGAFYSETPNSNSNVVRGNLIKNLEHTALSIWNEMNADWLIENNVLWASGNNSSPAGGPGNAFQWGSGDQILRFNTITRGCNSNCDYDSLGGIAGSTGTDYGSTYAAIDTRFYNNTIVKNNGPAITLAWFPNGASDLGRNKYVNNIIYDANSPGTGGDLSYYRSEDSAPGGIMDRYYGNIFGQPNQDSGASVIQTQEGVFSLSSAINALRNSGDPEYTAWNGFANTYKTSLGFANYGNDDFSLTSNSPAVDSGAPLTKVVAGCGSSTLTVDDARFFYAEAAAFPSWMGVKMDWVAIGTSVSSAAKKQITSVNDSTSKLTFSSPVSCSNGDYVWLWKDSYGNNVVSGNAPDVGAFEFPGGGGTILAAPTPPTNIQ